GGNQLAQAGRHNDQVAGRASRFIVGMGYPSGHKDGRPCAGLHSALKEAKAQRPFQNMPGFVVAIMDMEVVWPAAAPLLNVERAPKGRDRRLILCSRLM